VAKSGPHESAVRDALGRAVTFVLMPLARLLLRHGIPYKMADRLLRWAYVHVAATEFGIPGRLQTRSRISVITGLTRREVAKLLDADAPSERETVERFNRAARVLSGWQDDADFLDGEGRPLDLPVEEGDSSFSELVRRFGGNTPVRPVLDELERVGAVELIPKDRVRLVRSHYVPRASRETNVDTISIFGISVSDLIRTFDHNLHAVDEDPFIQRVIYSPRISRDRVPALRKRLREEAQQFADRVDRVLFEASLETGADDGESVESLRAGLGVYYFEGEEAS